jgi:enoyl-CoA hydratase/carnithine racemase
MAYKQLEPGISEISVDNPGSFNALSSKIIAGLLADFEGVCADPTTRAIIFRGAEVPGKFLAPLAGADLSMLVDRENWRPVPLLDAHQHMEEGIQAIESIQQFCRREEGEYKRSPAGRVVVIGLVDGPCLAGGIEFMFGLSDLVVATSRSLFGMREIQLGGMGGWRGPQRLRELLLSPLWVKEMLLALGDQKSGDISAATALQRGLINRLVPEAEIEGAVLGLAQRVAKLDPLAVTYNLEVADCPIEVDCTEMATNLMVELMQQPAWVNGVRKFFEGGKK